MGSGSWSSLLKKEVLGGEHVLRLYLFFLVAQLQGVVEEVSIADFTGVHC